MAVYLLVVYVVIRPFGAVAQAGFGIGMRVLQAGFMPAVALGFAVAPVAGQNFGARLAVRVRETFRTGVLMTAGVMALFAVLCHIAPAAMIRVFTSDPQVVAVGAEYLRIVSWNFVASGVIFVCSSTFQAMGNTVPALVSSFVRIALVVPAAFLLARVAGFELSWIWYLTVATVTLQMALSLFLIRLEFRSRLEFAPVAAT
jgi:Na+-driven multidrug efflux pump